MLTRVATGSPRQSVSAHLPTDGVATTSRCMDCFFAALLAMTKKREPVQSTGAAIHATSSNIKARCRSANRRYRCDRSLHGLLRRCAPRNDKKPLAGAVYRRGDPYSVTQQQVVWPICFGPSAD